MSIEFTFQWLRDGSPITGATQQAYELVEADAEAEIECDVVATNAAGSSAAVRSNAIGPINATPTPPPPPPPSGDFDPLAAYTGGWIPTTGTANLSKPAPPPVPAETSSGVDDPSWIDPRFGAAVFWIVGHGSIPDDVAYNHQTYSRIYPFERNDNGLVTCAGNGYFHFFEGDDFVRLTTNGRPGSPDGAGALKGVADQSTDIFWPPSRPRKLWYGGPVFGLGLIIRELDIDTGVSTTLIDMTGRLAAIGMPTAARLSMWGEGQPSNDGNIWAWIVTDADGNCLGLMSYQLDTDTILGHVLTTSRPNHISVSPLGNYVVPSWTRNTGLTRAAAEAADIDDTDGVRAYSLDFSEWTQVNERGQHSDMALDALGNEVLVTNCFSGGGQMDDRGVTDGDLYYAILATGVCHVFDNLYLGSDYANHFCGKCYDVPGFVLLDYHGGGGSTPRYRDGTIGLQELTPDNPRYIRLVHHQSVNSSVENVTAAPLAACNRDLTRVAFATNLGIADGFVGQALIGLPSDMLERLA